MEDLLPPPRKKYKAYFDDVSIPVPRRTKYRWKKQEEQRSSTSNSVQQEPSRIDREVSATNDTFVPIDTDCKTTTVNDGLEQCSESFDFTSSFWSSTTGAGQETPGNNDANPLFEEPVFSGSSVTIAEAVCMIVTIFLKHGMTRQCLADILKCICALLPQPNSFPPTKYKLIQLLSLFNCNDKPLYEKHYYCNKCQYYLSDGDLQTNVPETCPSCDTTVNGSDVGVFIHIPFQRTLKKLLEKQNIVQYFQQSSCSESITDIIDGSEYRRLKLDSTSNDFNLIWNTDGIPVFKSSKSQLWPVYFSIAELPPLLRNSHLIVSSLYFGSKKPDMNTFMKPFTDELTKLANDGISWVNAKTGEIIHSKVFAPICMADAPCRANLQNIMQYNGSYGCSTCEHPGKTHQMSLTAGHCRIYPESQQVVHKLRNGENMIEHAQQALISTNPVFGVKGPSYLMLLPKFDIGSGFFPDYMHNALLGVCRTITNAMFDTSNHEQPWYLGRAINDVDSKLLSIRPPNFITRVPRSITQRKFWKASEWRSWLLFYFIPVVHNTLPSKYVKHMTLFCYGIYILLREKISKDMLKLADLMLKVFLQDIPTLYGNEYCTYNVHQLTHLSLSVERWGPLWANSAFGFESSNGTLLRLIHGTQSVDKQLAQLIGIRKSLSAINYELEKRDTNGYRILKELQQGRTFPKSLVTFGNIKLGNKCNASINIEILAEVSLQLGQRVGSKEVQLFRRAFTGKSFCDVFTSEMYTAEQKRNSHIVLYTSNGQQYFGSIVCFIVHNSSILPSAIIRKIQTDRNGHWFTHNETNVTAKHIVPVIVSNETETNEFVSVPFDSIKCKCISILNYVCVAPNKWECNL